MAEKSGLDHRLALLCRKLGDLWTEIDAPPKESVVSQEVLKERSLTVFGKLQSNSNINYQAFLKTMTKAWKVDMVNFAKLDPDVLSFTFSLEADKNRVLENSPWSFASNLLMLKPWEPNKPPSVILLQAVLSGSKLSVSQWNGTRKKWYHM